MYESLPGGGGWSPPLPRKTGDRLMAKMFSASHRSGTSRTPPERSAGAIEWKEGQSRRAEPVGPCALAVPATAEQFRSRRQVRRPVQELFCLHQFIALDVAVAE